MVFQIQRGLFSSEFADHYALLGLPIDADAKEIRKSYLKIARRLHPDSTVSTSSEERQLAEQLLSKHINPAWECLAQEKSKVEYDLILRLKGKGYAADPAIVQSLGSVAQTLLKKSDVELEYRAILQALTTQQFENLSQSEEITAQLSELNLVYLIKTEGRTTTPPSGSKTSASASASSSAAQPTASPAPSGANPSVVRQSLADPYYNRAELAFRRQNYSQAILELRDGLKLEPENSRFHSLLGMVYLEQKQGTMARIHFDKALTCNPEDAMALMGKQRLQKMSAPAPSGSAKAKGKGVSKDEKSGGLFGGLFGKKK